MDNDNPRFPIDPDTLLKVFRTAWNELPEFHGKGILDSDHNVIGVKSLREWGEFMEVGETRRVAATHLNGFWISTVFLGIDHSFGGGRPLWFETMIFRDDENPVDVGEQIRQLFTDAQWRYETWAEAAQGHQQIVTIIREGLF